MVIEKRRERRLKVRLPVRITYPQGGTIFTHTENISRLGTYVEIDREIPLGVHLDMVIDIPAYTSALSLTGELRCWGDVFRCNLIGEIDSNKIYGVGIFFTDFFSPQDRDKLSKYIDFLILKEQEDIKQAIQRWRGKRRKRRD